VFDPYIGAGAGYVQVTPLLGTLPPLIVIPSNKTSPLEGWRFLTESGSAKPYYQSQTFEGLYEWMFHTQAYAEAEWDGIEPWNEPTSAVLKTNESRTYGLKFYVADSIRQIETKLVEVGHPGNYSTYVSTNRTLNSSLQLLSESQDTSYQMTNWESYFSTIHPLYRALVRRPQTHSPGLKTVMPKQRDGLDTILLPVDLDGRVSQSPTKMGPFRLSITTSPNPLRV
jgi:hypothetical protein